GGAAAGGGRDGGGAAAVSDQACAQDGPQGAGVPRGALVQHEPLLELPVRAQCPRPEQRDQVVQLPQVVLHGRGGQKQAVTAPDLAHQPPVGGAGVFELVGFIDDQKVVFQAENDVAVGRAFGGIQGGNDHRATLPVVLAALQGGGNAELLFELPVPLPGQGG